MDSFQHVFSTLTRRTKFLPSALMHAFKWLVSAKLMRSSHTQKVLCQHQSLSRGCKTSLPCVCFSDTCCASAFFSVTDSEHIALLHRYQFCGRDKQLWANQVRRFYIALIQKPSVTQKHPMRVTGKFRHPCR
jgi:hypothetical protein